MQRSAREDSLAELFGTTEESGTSPQQIVAGFASFGLEAILKVIHDLEPAGIGARNLRECLLLQLSQLPMTTRSRRLARKILTSYFDEFAKKHYEKLISRLQVR